MLTYSGMVDNSLTRWMDHIAYQRANGDVRAPRMNPSATAGGSDATYTCYTHNPDRNHTHSHVPVGRGTRGR